jgi:hypothetical protein
MDWFSKNKYWLAGSGFFILSAILRFVAVDQTPHPSGWDGYYYVMQVHSWLTFGYLHSPDFSLIYPYFAAITYLVGDPILGFKVGVSIISGLLVVSVFFSLNKRSSDFALVCLICSYLVFSPLTTYFIFQFPKNALGLVFLVFFIASLPKVIPGVILFAATIMTHRMTGGFAIIVVLLHVLRFLNKKWILIGFAAIVAIGFLPGIIHISDLQRFNGQFVLIPHWAPYSFYQLFPRTFDAFFKTELVLVSMFIIYAAWKWRPIIASPWFPIAVISIFPFFAFVAGDIGHRFFLIAPVALILMMTYGKTYPVVNWSLVVVVLTLSSYSWKSYKKGFDPPNNHYQRITEVLSEKYDPYDYPLVIAHKSLAEMITFRTDFDALNWLPPEDMPPQHVLRLINQVKYSDFRKYLDTDELQKIRHVAGRYSAVPEDVWQKFVSKATKAKDKLAMKRIYSGYNPMDRRPYFLSKGKSR